MVPAILHSFFFDSLKDGHLPKPDTKGWSLPFFSHFLCFSIRWTLPQTGHLQMVPAVLHSFFFDSLQDGHLPKPDTKGWSLPFFSHFLCFSLRWTTPNTGHLELVATVLQSFSLTLYKTDTSLNRKPRAGPCRSSFSWTLYKMHPLL